MYTALSIHPSIQEANGYRSGLLQAAVVAAFTTYNIFSAVMRCAPCSRLPPYRLNDELLSNLDTKMEAFVFIP